MRAKKRGVRVPQNIRRNEECESERGTERKEGWGAGWEGLWTHGGDVTLDEESEGGFGRKCSRRWRATLSDSQASQWSEPLGDRFLAVVVRACATALKPSPLLLLHSRNGLS